MGSDDLDRAMSLLKRADAADKQCARVSIMFGRIYMAQNDYAKAAESLQRVLSQDKELVSETLPMLQECYTHLPEQQHNWAEFLKRCVEENTGATADLMLAGSSSSTKGATWCRSISTASCNAIRPCGCFTG